MFQPRYDQHGQLLSNAESIQNIVDGATFVAPKRGNNAEEKKAIEKAKVTGSP